MAAIDGDWSIVDQSPCDDADSNRVIAVDWIRNNESLKAAIDHPHTHTHTHQGRLRLSIEPSNRFDPFPLPHRPKGLAFRLALSVRRPISDRLSFFHRGSTEIDVVVVVWFCFVFLPFDFIAVLRPVRERELGR